MTDRAARVLRVLADLSPSGDQQRQSALRIPTEWFTWLPARDVSVVRTELHDFVAPRPESAQQTTQAPRPLETPYGEQVGTAQIDRALGERLAKVDLLRPEQRSLRVGWLFVAGRTTLPDGKVRRVFTPLVTVPVRVQRSAGLGRATLVRAGDLEVNELVRDPVARAQLEDLQDGGGYLSANKEPAIPAGTLSRLENLRRYAWYGATAAGFAGVAQQLVPASDAPERLMSRDSLFVVAGVGVYAVHETGATSKAGSLLQWATQDLSTPTAFSALYLDQVARAEPDTAPVHSPYLLTADQKQAVRRARTESVTLLSGAPGTGKSHTVAAIACDALSRGQSVLVTAKANATVDALLDLFEKAPGPDPVVFGSNERREQLATRLAGGQVQPVPDDVVERALQAYEEAALDASEIEQEVKRSLAAEQLLTGTPVGARRARRAAPAWFEPGADLRRAAELGRKVADVPDGWWGQRRHAKRSARLRELAGATDEVELSALLDALTWARAEDEAAALTARGGLSLTVELAELRAARRRLREAVGVWLAADSRAERRLGRSELTAVGRLATALRSGRAARRAQLATMDESLVHALPLWAGSLPDIDDLLPPVAGLFDLVILDEASSLDQPLAVPALLRGKRAVVVGDPQQLRHVSFLSDQQAREVLARHGLANDPVAARLDVRRNSLFDVAAGVTPVQVLSEHFRSSPHLVDFVAQRVYGGRMRVATRKPSNQSQDCVELERLHADRTRAGVVVEEVDWVIRSLRGLLGGGASSVGVVTPFRAQADALEAAVLEAFTADQLSRLGLRVGTVHAFQGNERDVVLASMGIGGSDTAGTWRFAEDPHLMTVLLTRARTHLTVVLSADPPPGGLMADYLAQADHPPGPPPPAGESSPWVRSLAHDLRLGGAEVLPAYPVGHHTLDLVAAAADVAVEAQVHPDGPKAHVERHLALLEAGWTIHDAYGSRWSARRGELVVELLHVLRG